jgi:hypothetical protein
VAPGNDDLLIQTLPSHSFYPMLLPDLSQSRTEQVISACCVAFAHGANDVANAIGPFSAIMTVYGQSPHHQPLTLTPSLTPCLSNPHQGLALSLLPIQTHRCGSMSLEASVLSLAS